MGQIVSLVAALVAVAASSFALGFVLGARRRGLTGVDLERIREVVWHTPFYSPMTGQSETTSWHLTRAAAEAEAAASHPRGV